jgi:hypothetical protein
MKNSCAFRLAALFALLSCSTFTGCSVIGFGVGSLIDAGTPAKRVQDSVDVSALRAGRKVTLTTSDGFSVTGKCGGWIQRTDSVYLMRYERAVENRLTPARESPVTVVTSDTQQFDAMLMGFQVNTERRDFRDRGPKPADPWEVCLRANGAATETCLALRNINAIKVPDGGAFPSEALSTRLAAGSVPTRSHGTGRPRYSIGDRRFSGSAHMVS